jgi:hypothetical protein
MKRDLVIVIAAALGLSACGGGSSSSDSGSSGSGGSAALTGFAIPTEISAVPTNSSSATSSSRGLTSYLRTLARAVSDLPADSDYKKTTTRKYIEEHSLEQFSIIETIMKAVAQTNYADAENIDIGPYKVMVSWEEKQGDVDVKTLEPWVVSSSMITLNGQDVNRLQAWIEEVDDGTAKLIKAQFDIYQSATQNADGSYADYGVWDLNVKFNDAATDFFVAKARIEKGMTVLKINQSETLQEGEMPQPVTFTTKAVMHRAGGQGYGQVAYTDISCDQNGCAPDPLDVKYAYNSDYLALDDGSNVVYKDRTSQTEFANRYGLFYASAGTDANGKAIAVGDNLTKHKSFGFPVSYTDSNGMKQHAYYGAWQGRHSLWANGGSVPAGTEVKREDRGPNQTAETYYVSSPFTGTLTKRTLGNGALSDIQGIPVETWINKHWDLMWNQAAGEWKSCAGWIEWGWDDVNQKDTLTCREFTAPDDPNPPTDIGFSTFDKFGLLVADDSGRKSVNIGRWDDVNQQPMNYVYDANGPSGAGFYEAQETQTDHGPVWQSNGTKYNPQDGDNIWVDIGGSIYIQYTGNFTSPNTGWIQRKLTSFDQQTWTPSFDPNGDAPFYPERGREYYINNNGANFVVKRKGVADAAASYEVKIELQASANPVNYASILPTGTSYLRTPWRPEVEYEFVTDSADENFMKLIYRTDDPNTPDDESATPTVYTSGEWGLQAYNTSKQPLMADGTPVNVDEWGFPTDPDQRPVEFNWEYSSDGGWGAQTFLCTTVNCAATTD